MKIGGHNEVWMVVGPLLAVGLVLSIAMGGPEDMLRLAERFANDGWDVIVRTFRH